MPDPAQTSCSLTRQNPMANSWPVRVWTCCTSELSSKTDLKLLILPSSLQICVCVCVCVCLLACNSASFNSGLMSLFNLLQVTKGSEDFRAQPRSKCEQQKCCFAPGHICGSSVPLRNARFFSVGNASNADIFPWQVWNTKWLGECLEALSYWAKHAAQIHFDHLTTWHFCSRLDIHTSFGVCHSCKQFPSKSHHESSHREEAAQLLWQHSRAFHAYLGVCRRTSIDTSGKSRITGNAKNNRATVVDGALLVLKSFGVSMALCLDEDQHHCCFKIDHPNRQLSKPTLQSLIRHLSR